MRRRVTRAALGFLALFLCMRGTASAAPDARRGVIRPELQTWVVWDDNAAHEPRGGRSETFFRISPGIRADLRRERWRIGGHASADALMGDSRPDETFWRVEAHGELEPLAGLSLRLANHYVPQPLELGRPRDDRENLVQSNTLLAQARYARELGRGAGIELGLHAERFTTDSFTGSVDADGDGLVDGERSLRSDFWGHGLHAEFHRPLGRRLEPFVRADYRQRRFDEIGSADFDELSAVIGVRVRAARGLFAEVATGWGRVDFDGLPSDRRSIGRLRVEYRPSPRWIITTSVLRRLTGDAAAADFRETSARLGVERLLGRRTRLYAGLWWSRFGSDVRGLDRDGVLAAELRLRRQITRRIEAVLAYRRWENRGDLQENDFTHDRVTLGLVYRY